MKGFSEGRKTPISEKTPVRSEVQSEAEVGGQTPRVNKTPNAKCPSTDTSESEGGGGDSSGGSPRLAYPGVVSCLDETIDSKTSDPPSRHRHPTSTMSSRGNSSPTQVTETSGRPLVRRQLKETGLSQDATRLVIGAWRPTTQKQYQSYITEWEIFCNTAGYDPISAPFNVGVNFLADLANRVGYSAVNTARSILSSFIIMPDGSSFGKHPVVKKLLKGVFEWKPSLPRYTEVWDLNVVLTYIKCLPENNGLSVKQITLKLATLLAILTGQRCQTLHSLTLNSINFTDGQCVLYINKLIKQSRPGLLQEYKQDSKLCVIQCLKSYLSSTDSLRQNAQELFVSYQKPYKPVSKDTIARWIRCTLCSAGVDTTIYDAHSTRAASTTAAARQGVPIQLFYPEPDGEVIRHSPSSFMFSAKRKITSQRLFLIVAKLTSNYN